MVGRDCRTSKCLWLSATDFGAIYAHRMMEPAAVAIVALLLVAVSIGVLLVLERRQRRREQILIHLLATFGPAMVTGRRDPESFVVWAEIAGVARVIFPEAFVQLDTAVGGRFPFSPEVVEAVHARWTADWLAWERQHDLDYKGRASAVEVALAEGADDEVLNLRTQLSSINQEKIQTYQDRYESYVRISKAIRALEDPRNGRRAAGSS